MKSSKNNIATKSDLLKLEDQLTKIIQTVEKKLHAEIIRVRIDMDGLKQELKDEMSKNTSKILDTFDKFVSEIKTAREEKEVISYRLSNHEERIERLEQTVLPSPK